MMNLYTEIRARIAADMIIPTSVDEDIAVAESVQDQLQDMRVQAVQKLNEIVSAYSKEDLTSDPKIAAMNQKNIDTLFKGLSEIEKSSYARVDVKLRKVESEGSNRAASAVAEFLSQTTEERANVIRALSATLGSEFSDDLDGVSDDISAEIEETNAIQDFEMKTDPYDHSEV